MLPWIESTYNDYSTVMHGMTTLIKVATVNRKIQVITVSSMHGFSLQKVSIYGLEIQGYNVLAMTSLTHLLYVKVSS